MSVAVPSQNVAHDSAVEMVDQVSRRGRPASGTARETLDLLQDMIGDAEHLCMVTPMIADKLDCAPQTARKRMISLEEAGLITAEVCHCEDRRGTHLRVRLTAAGRVRSERPEIGRAHV